MSFQVFGEAVGLAPLSGILASIGSVIPLSKRSVYRFAGRRSSQQGHQKCEGSEYQLSNNMHNPTFFSSLLHHGVAERTADCPRSEVQTAYSPYSDNKRPLWYAEKNPLFPPLRPSRQWNREEAEKYSKNAILGHDPFFLIATKPLGRNMDR